MNVVDLTSKEEQDALTEALRQSMQTEALRQSRKKRKLQSQDPKEEEKKEDTIIILDDDSSESSDQSIHNKPTKPPPPTTSITTTTASTTRYTTNSNSRYSKRDRKSTLIYIDNQPVLRQNNYDVTEREYIHNAFQSIDQAEYYRNKNKQDERQRAKYLAKSVGRVPVVYKPSPAEMARMAQNQKVKARVDALVPRRTAFLRNHLEVLAPFLEPKVYKALEAIPNPKPFIPKQLHMQPEGITGELRDYQLAGLQFMQTMNSQNIGMILGDEMGLGKTLQTIALLCHLKETAAVCNAAPGKDACGIKGPSLVVCPLSVLYSWCNELERWAPGLKFMRFHSSGEEERDKQKKEVSGNPMKYDVIVTTYEMIKNPNVGFLWKRLHFNYLILDEGHRIKNHDCLITKALNLLHCGNRLILTGTPLQNNLVELWSLLNFLLPDVFTTLDPFEEGFNITSAENTIDRIKLKAAHNLLGLFMIRRMKDQVEKLMPPKIETQVVCPLSTTQIYWYKALLLKDMNLLAKVSQQTDGEPSVVRKKELGHLFMELRKCCLHPFLFKGAETDIESTTLTKLISASGKLSVLDALLRSLFQKKHRVVLFSQFTSVLDILEDYARERGWIFSRFDGSTNRAQRNYRVNRFNAENSNVFLFLMSTRAGGMGLNLQTADTCILFDSDWNPQPDIQAMARVHRIGQKKTVHVYRLVSGGTVEERMIERAQKKLYLDKMVNTGEVDDDNDDNKELSHSELMTSLKFGCQAVFGDSSQNALPTDEDIELITDRSRTEDYSAGKLKGGLSHTTKDFDTEVKLRKSTDFGGADFVALREEYKNNALVSTTATVRNIASEWTKIMTEKRESKKRLTMVASTGSGMGPWAPVLSENNYGFGGETSVFERELGGRGQKSLCAVTKKKQAVRKFGQQDFCQVCKSKESHGLVVCPRCPVAIHLHCVGLKSKKELMCCSHHYCTTCGKTNQAAGGMLFPCQSCHLSFCEDCLPDAKTGMRLLGECPRFEEMDHDSTKNKAYIHCSTDCEQMAKKLFRWKQKEVGSWQGLPDPIDISSNFGRQISETNIS